MNCVNPTTTDIVCSIAMLIFLLALGIWIQRFANDDCPPTLD